MPTLPHLETDRLILRPLALSDAPAMEALVSDRAIAATTLNIPHPYPEGGGAQYIAHTQATAEKGTFATFGIFRKADDQFVGCIGVVAPHETHRTSEMGYWIGRPYWGQGYATEAGHAILAYAFDTMGANKVWAQFFTDNPASGKVMQKIGMRLEGTLRQHVSKWGEFKDISTYGILRSDFRPTEG